jgi:hypothetical protein
MDTDYHLLDNKLHQNCQRTTSQTCYPDTIPTIDTFSTTTSRQIKETKRRKPSTTAQNSYLTPERMHTADNYNNRHINRLLLRAKTNGTHTISYPTSHTTADTSYMNLQTCTHIGYKLNHSSYAMGY